MIKSFHPSLLNAKTETFSFSEAPKKKSKDFRLHLHPNSDMIKLEWDNLPIRMTFYSTKKNKYTFERDKTPLIPNF